MKKHKTEQEGYSYFEEAGKLMDKIKTISQVEILDKIIKQEALDDESYTKTMLLYEIAKLKEKLAKINKSIK